MEPPERWALRVLRLVHELHKQGYQLLRIAPGMSMSGCHWRCAVIPKSNVLKNHGAMVKDFRRVTAHYSSAQRNAYFGWMDAQIDTAQQLAVKFVKRFPQIVEASLGDDSSYADWYVQMLGYAEQARFPIAYADWGEWPDERFLPLTRGDSDLPMPPPGDAEQEP